MVVRVGTNVTSSMQVFYFKACPKCRGDITLDPGEEPYCIQCSKRFYGKVERKALDSEPKVDKKRDGDAVRTPGTEKDDRIIRENPEIVKLLKTGELPTVIANILGVNRRYVSRVREVMMQLDANYEEED